MRVIAGSARGIHLSSLKGEKTRPIQDRIKGALFNILSDVIPGSCVLDMYAGTGAIGIEALSRGAKSCVFIEKDDLAVKIIRENLRKTRLEDKSQVLKYDVFEVVPYLEKNNIVVDLILASPPYPLVEKCLYRDDLLTLFSSLCEKHIIKSDGIIMLQHKRMDDEIPLGAFGLKLFDTRVYGCTQLSFFRTL